MSTKIKPKTKEANLAGMLHLPGGTFLMGSNDDEGFPQDKEGPIREVQVPPFYMAPHAVTNADFAGFVAATGYQTEAEVFGWSFVFEGFLPQKIRKKAQRVQQAPWWCRIKQACWKWPEGRGSHIGDRQNHPVVHVSWNDAQAYCKWAGMRLPTEVEWEFAARGGLMQKRYPWGDELEPGGEHQCNIWQGDFPNYNAVEDGFFGTCPVGSFPPNGFGLYEVAGNVWEWCADPFDQQSPQSRTIRGGSYLCHASYCNRYRVAARSSNTIDSSTGHTGFRCASS